MTTLTRTELSNIYTTDTEAPIVDGLGNPRFVSEDDFSLDNDPSYGMSIIDIEEDIREYNMHVAEWEEEQRFRDCY